MIVSDSSDWGSGRLGSSAFATGLLARNIGTAVVVIFRRCVSTTAARFLVIVVIIVVVASIFCLADLSSGSTTLRFVLE